MRWPTAPLGDLCNVISGGTPKRTVDDYWNGDIPWVKISDMLQSEITSTDECITELGLQESPARLLEPGTLLLSIFATVGRTAVLHIPAATNQAIVGLQLSKDTLDQVYLRHFLDSQTAALKQRSRGVAQENINTTILKQLQIPLPPLEEQRRIAAILDKAQVVAHLADLADRLASSLIESELIRRFGRPGEPCADYDILSLVDAGVAVIDCPHSTPKWTEQGKICLRTSNLGQGSWVWDDTRRISSEDFWERSRRALLEPGDIVLSREGTVGIAAIVQPEMEACMGQRLVQLKLDTSRLAPDYLLAQLLYLLRPERMSHALTGSTSKHINVKDLRQLQIPCPPINDQLAFQAFCESARSLRSNVQALGGKTTGLSRSMRAAYFLP
jgi:type I restriction enzyme S subunit